MSEGAQTYLHKYKFALQCPS